MTALLLNLLCGATVFLEQEIPGLRYFAVDPLTGAISANYRQIDLDRDARTDLLFADRVLFQRDGLYPSGSTAKLPDTVSGALCDTDDHSIYLRYPGGLRQLVWKEDAWSVAAEQEMDWPDLPIDTDNDDSAALSLPMTFARFLVDIDASGVPAIVVYARDGVHIYRKKGRQYQADTVIDIYPQVVATAAASGPVWPPEDRRLAAPGQQLDLTAVWRDAQLTMVSRQDLRTGAVQYRSRSYHPAGDELTAEMDYPLMHPSMRPVYLNEDDVLDFAGGAAVSTSVSAFTEPIYDTFVSTDEGNTVHRFRTKSFAPRNIFVDIDGDGDIDIVTHETRITAGGLRESLNRYFFQRGVGHEVSFFIQNDSGQFESAPHLAVDLTIQLEKVPYREGSIFRRYRSGDLIDVTGDFNGDGLKDIVVQESSESIAIYISRGYRFSKHPIYYLSVQDNERFYVTDVDGNGMSDVVLIQPGADRTGDRSRVYFARQTKP